jgi:hypothetical protein
LIPGEISRIIVLSAGNNYPDINLAYYDTICSVFVAIFEYKSSNSETKISTALAGPTRI